MNVRFITFGCKVNTYETQCMREQLLKNGFTESENADVIVINSCTVTSRADAKLFKELHRLRREFPDALIVLTGCYPQAHETGEGSPVYGLADIIIGTSGRDRLPELIHKHIKGDSERSVGRAGDVSFGGITYSEGHTRGFIKINDGCDMCCAYCIIPKARGHMHSRPLDEIRKEASALAESGCHEIVLVGINIMFYGREWGIDIGDAVYAASEPSKIVRVRLSSIEPEKMTDDLLDRLAECEKFCPSFHLSLQSGCDSVLKRMNRRYDTDTYSTIVEKIRSKFYEPVITTDIITGFPEETMQEHEISLDFVRQTGFAAVHVFPFSLREGTKAETMIQVPDGVKTRRSAEMGELARELSLQFNRQYIGRDMEVLFEREKKDGTHRGHTKNYLSVMLINKYPQSMKGVFHTVRIISADENTLYGKLSDEKGQR